MQKKIIIANWKMNLDRTQAVEIIQQLLDAESKFSENSLVEIILAPGFLFLPEIAEILKKTQSNIKLAAQNFFPQPQGPYTGEISILQIKPYVEYCLVGHSERRNFFNEADEFVRQKTFSAHENNVKPVICIGETAEERDKGLTAEILQKQLKSALFDLTPEQIADSIVAYEPVWAIGGHQGAIPATPEIIQSTLRIIQSLLADLFSIEIAVKIPILYGGSVSLDNISTVIALENCAGVLVGGASLKIDQFLAIINNINNRTS